MKRLDVLFVCLNLNDKVGGIETFNQLFIKGLEENNFSFKTLVLHDKKPTEAESIVTFSSRKVYFILSVI